jgi:hypothetical protein
MIVALPRATVDGHTLFGHNSNRPASEGQALVRVPGRVFAAGEVVRTRHREVPQVRRTYSVLGNRPGSLWGYLHGINEHDVAIGVTSIHTKLWNEDLRQKRLSGTDLVRLGLERSTSAHQAVEVVTDLIGRFGQGGDFESTVEGDDPEEVRHDNAFLIADAREAYVLEACDTHWALQEVGAVRAVSDFCHLHQDWDRISRGLADLVIARGWWPANGSKLDFARAVAHEGVDQAPGLYRWGHATLLLEQHNGQIDAPFLRGLLADHFEPSRPPPSPGRADEDASPWGSPPHTPCLCRHAFGSAPGTAGSMVAHLASVPGQLTVAWCALGPPCAGVYFPLVLEGDLPAAFLAEGPGGSRMWQQMQRLGGACRRERIRAGFAGLQERFNQEVREFLAEAAPLKQIGATEELSRLAGSFMQHAVECFEEITSGIPVRAKRRMSEEAWVPRATYEY